MRKIENEPMGLILKEKMVGLAAWRGSDLVNDSS